MKSTLFLLATAAVLGASQPERINRSNVQELQVAWTYHTGALQPVGDLNEKAAFEATPLLVGRMLYVSTPFNQVIALDAATGVELWKFDPKVDRSHGYSEVTSRGVSFWRSNRGSIKGSCSERIFEGTIDARLIALDAKSGRLCSDFGKEGQIDLTEGIELLGGRGDYQVTSPPAVIGDLVVTGSSIGDNRAVNVESGLVRAFDARSGRLQWKWNPIEWADQQKLRTGAANAWAAIATDAERGLVFVPTGSASPDFYGGERPGNDEHANSVVALKAATGKVVWSYQLVHHDLWDFDVPAKPVLIRYRGRDALAVMTKSGLVFVLDRDTGRPLHDVVERPVPASDIPGEHASPTQPIPAWAAVVPQRLTAETVWGPTAEARRWCEEKVKTLRNEGLFTPPSLQGSLYFPGNIGGVNWGGDVWDEADNLLIANTNRLATIVKLIPRARFHGKTSEGDENRIRGEYGRQAGTPYLMHRGWLFSPSGLPCNAPPWGATVAFDLNTGTVRWETPIGALGNASHKYGSPNLGGPAITKEGLVFSAAGMDTFLYAFSANTGEELWKGMLPASAQATPISYELDGQQFVVICAGGHGKLGTKMGDAVVAFALPRRSGTE